MGRLVGICAIAAAGMIAATAAMLPRAAEAVSITRIAAGGITLGANGRAAISFDAFDPSFIGENWRLDRATVTVSLLTQITYLTTVNLQPTEPVGLAPVPYTFDVIVSQDFSPAGFPSVQGFDTILPRFDIATGVATGLGGTSTVSIVSNYSFRFDSRSDLIGGIASGGNSLFQAFREEFVKTEFSDRVGTSLSVTSLQGSGLPVTPILFSGGGAIIVQYDSTLVPAAPAVPVPAGLPLLATGVGVFAWAARRRRAR